MAQRGRSELGVGWVLTWPLTLAFAAMVFLTARELSQPNGEVAPLIGGPDWEARLPARMDAITSALRDGPVRLGAPVEEKQGSGTLRWVHRRYVVPAAAQDHALIDLTISNLQQLDPGLTVASQATSEGVEIHIGLDGLLTHTVVIRSGEPAGPPPRLALMVVALGDDLRLAREFVGLDAPVALGVRPFRPFSREVAELAHHFGREVWIDLTPREPEAADDEAEPEPTEASVGEYLDAALGSVPHALGVAYDTSAPASVTSAADSLGKELERRRLYYVISARRKSENDSHVPQTLAVSEGDENGKSTALAQLASTAQAHGPVIGLAQPSVITPQALGQSFSEWRADGIDLVPVSTMMQPAALSAH